jgi:hypothetical protein
LAKGQATAISVEINMVGEPRRPNGLGQDVLVGGLYHNVTVGLNVTSDNVQLLAYYSGVVTETNRTNAYMFNYTSGVWTDGLYNYYLNASACSRTGDVFQFVAALDQTASVGNWSLAVLVDGAEMENRTFMVEAPIAGIYMSAPTFYFRIEPFGSGFKSSYNSADPNNSTGLTTRNIGNTPLDVEIYYNNYNALFETSNYTGVFHPGEERIHYVDFQAQSWSPRKMEVQGFIHGEPRLLATPDTISCTVTPQTSFSVVVIVARQGFDIFQMSGVAVQYKQLLPAKYKDSINLDLYLTGTNNTYFSVNGYKLDVNSVNYEGQTFDQPFQLSLRDDVEAHVLVNVTCSIKPPKGEGSMMAYVNYTVELTDFSDSGTCTSSIIVAPTAEESQPIGLGSPSVLAIIFVVSAILIITAFALYSRRKVVVEKRSTLEERIRKRKEKARRQR